MIWMLHYMLRLFLFCNVSFVLGEVSTVVIIEYLVGGSLHHVGKRPCGASNQ